MWIAGKRTHEQPHLGRVASEEELVWACKRHSYAVVSAESAGEVKHDAHPVCHETPDYDCWDACNTSEIRVRVVGNTEAEIALAFRDGSRKKTVAMAGICNATS